MCVYQKEMKKKEKNGFARIISSRDGTKYLIDMYFSPSSLPPPCTLTRHVARFIYNFFLHLIYIYLSVDICIYIYILLYNLY